MSEAKCRLVIVDVAGDAGTIRTAILSALGLVDSGHSATGTITWSGWSNEPEGIFPAVCPTVPTATDEPTSTPAKPECVDTFDCGAGGHSDACPASERREPKPNGATATSGGTIKQRLVTYLEAMGESSTAVAAEELGCSQWSVTNLLRNNDPCFVSPSRGRIALTEAGKRYARG